MISPTIIQISTTIFKAFMLSLLLLYKTLLLFTIYLHTITISSSSSLSSNNLLSPEYTIRVNTYKRPHQLVLFLQHYTTCPSVSYIHIIWSDLSSSPPSLPSSLTNSHVHISYEIHTTTSLNNRFFNLTSIPTSAVLSIDDDVIIECESIIFAYSVFKANPEVLVGFSPRLNGYNPISGDSQYFRWQHTWWNGMYSIILTKACFLDTKYLTLFQQYVPTIVLEKIDSLRNGEDIAMAYLVANITKSPPVWVKVSLYETSESGISSGGISHFIKRSEIVDKLHEVSGISPWVLGYQKATKISWRDYWKLLFSYGK